VELIEAILVINVKQQHKTYRHTNGQTADIDERRNLVADKVAPGNFKVVFKHKQLICL
jgi:hypothetical protein